MEADEQLTNTESVNAVTVHVKTTDKKLNRGENKASFYVQSTVDLC